MPGAGLRREDQERAGGARDCGEVQAKRWEGVVTEEQGTAALASIASARSGGVAGKAK
jgi:hypothetical protein